MWLIFLDFYPIGKYSKLCKAPWIFYFCTPKTAVWLFEILIIRIRVRPGCLFMFAIVPKSILLTVVKLFSDSVLIDSQGRFLWFTSALHSAELFLLLDFFFFALTQFSTKTRAETNALGVSLVVNSTQQKATLAIVYVPIQLNQQRLLLKSELSFLWKKKTYNVQSVYLEILWRNKQCLDTKKKSYHHFRVSRRARTRALRAFAYLDEIFRSVFRLLPDSLHRMLLLCIWLQLFGRCLENRISSHRGTRDPAKVYRKFGSKTCINLQGTNFFYIVNKNYEFIMSKVMSVINKRDNSISF